MPDGDHLYQAAVRDDTLVPSLATDRGPAVAAAVADRAAAHTVSPASTVQNLEDCQQWHQRPPDGEEACLPEDSAPPA